MNITDYNINYNSSSISPMKNYEQSKIVYDNQVSNGLTVM